MSEEQAPSPPARPPRYKQAVITWHGVYPILTVTLALLAPLMKTWPLSTNQWCRRRDSNPHAPEGAAEFKSAASAISPHRHETGGDDGTRTRERGLAVRADVRLRTHFSTNPP
jgi:hypothetical protein